MLPHIFPCLAIFSVVAQLLGHTKNSCEGDYSDGSMLRHSDSLYQVINTNLWQTSVRPPNFMMQMEHSFHTV